MNELLIQVHAPAINATYDIIIPTNVRIYELTKLITNVVVSLSDGLFLSQDVVLCDGDTGVIYNATLTVDEIGLRNGANLILV